LNHFEIILSVGAQRWFESVLVGWNTNP
jgi:hypothetical protein